MSATDILRLAENNALRIAKAPQLAFALEDLGSGSGNSGSESGGFVENDQFLENSGNRLPGGGNGGGYYKGNGGNQKSKTTIKGKLKNKIAMIILVGLLGGGGAFMATSNALLPGSIVSNFTKTFDTQYTPTVTRGNFVFNYMTKNTKTLTNFLAGYGKIPNSMVKKLNAQGIEVDINTHSFQFKGDTITGDNLSSVLKNNLEFRKAYDTARSTRMQGFFDKTAKNTYQNDIKISRNNIQGDGTYKDDISKQVSGGSSKTEIGGKTEEPELNDDGSQKINPDTGEVETTIEKFEGSETASASSNTTKVEAEAKAGSYVKDMSAKAAKATNWTCAAIQVANLISVAAMTTELFKAMPFFMTLAESITRMMVGDGENSKIHEAMASITEAAQSTVSDLTKVNVTGGSIADQNLTAEAGTITTTKAAVEDPGFQSVVGGLPLNSSAGANYSFERVNIALAFIMGIGSKQALRTCTGLQAGLSTVSIAVMAGGFLAGGGIGAAVALVFNGVSTRVLGMLASVAIGALLQFMVPTISNMFTNPVETVVGEPLGAMTTKGSFLTEWLGKTGNAQTPGAASVAFGNYKQTQEVLALDAELDRYNRSPFDINSPNTFLGSIAHSLLPSTLTSSSTINLNSGLTTITHATSKAIASLTNSAYADGDGSSYMTTYGNCPRLEEIGAVGDIYCNPIMVSDLSTTNIDPEDQAYVDAISSQLENCNDTGYCNIRKNSELDKFTKYCAYRNSPYGITDSNILSELQLGNPVTTNLPLIGELIDIINGVIDEPNQKWADGSYCVNNKDTNPRWEAEFKYYQLYISDQRILEQMGAYDSNSTTGYSTNPVVAAMERYEAEHPRDNSSAGILSRYTGMSKDNAETVIAVVEYYEFLDTYDSSTRIAMEDGVVKTSDEVIAEALNTKPWQYNSHHDLENKVSKIIFYSQQAIYADIRNRSYAA